MAGLRKIKAKKKKVSKNATVMVFNPFQEEQFVSTGSLGFDVLLSEQALGSEIGSLIEVNGDSGLGKSTTVFANSCKRARLGVKVVYVDAEMGVKQSHVRLNNAFELFHPDTENLLEQYGDDIHKYLIHAFDGGSIVVLQANSFNGLDDITKAVYEYTEQSEDPVDLVIDSLAFLNTTAELDAEQADKIQIGQKARAWRRWCVSNKINLAAHGVTTWFINHLTTQGISANSFLTHEKPHDESAGGKISQYAPDVRILIKKGKKIEDKEENEIGHEAKVFTKKNRNNISHRQIIIPMIKGKGPDNALFIKQVLSEEGLVKFSAWTTFDLPFLEEPVKVNGSEAAIDFIREHEEEFIQYLHDENALSLVEMGEVVKSDKDNEENNPEIDSEDEED